MVNSLGGPISLVWQSLWGLQGGPNSVSQVDGVSDMAPVCRLFWGLVFRKATMASAHLNARHFSFSLYTTGTFQAATWDWSSEEVSLSR